MAYRIVVGPGQSARQQARRQCAALDRLLDYPRSHADNEPGVQRAPGRPAPYTETHTRPLEHADGRAAIEIDATVARLHGQAVTDGGPVHVVIDATPTDVELPDGRDAWTEQPPRGGL